MKIFSPALKRQIKDCILAVFWPRKEIYKFFKDCSCPANVMKTIENWEKEQSSRAAMIDQVFDTLGDLPDNGTLQFNLMLEALADWTHFDRFWFETEKKLDLEDAKRKISELRAAKSKSVDAARQRAEERKQKTQLRESRLASLEEMRTTFHSISQSSETPQKRGLAFEKFLAGMARFYDMKVTEAFRVKGTQIDGTIKYDGENYLIEAKWHDRSMSDEPLMAFCHKQEMNMHGRGIFISINGFSEGALHMLERSHIKNTVLMDGEDITLILNELVTLPETLERKISAAQTRGKFYINPVLDKSKIKS